MSNRRPQDLTRFKKTYSYSRQEPITVSIRETSVNLERTRDLTRFRKTYSQFRQQPIASQASVAIFYISTEILEPILTEEIIGFFLVPEDDVVVSVIPLITESGEYLVLPNGDLLIA